MNTITDTAGAIQCSCGSKAEPKDRNRFLKRHPRICSERREFTKQIARGTRCVDDEDAIAARVARWDAIERALGSEPGT